MIIYTKDEIYRHIQLNHETIQVIDDAFTSLETKNVAMPPIMRVDVPEHNGEVDVKSAYVEGIEMFAIKVSSGFFNNYKLGLPSGNGLMMLINSVTGQPESLLLDNGYLTDIRTAAAGAVAANYLASENARTAGVIGAGSQARYQLKALKLMRDIEQVTVYGPTEKRVREFAEEMEKDLGMKVTIASSPEQVVTESDVVITTTPSKKPVIKAEWLHPGLHITAMGSDAEEKQELEAGILEKADLFVCDVREQSKRLGELHHASDSDAMFAKAVELGEITSGKRQGRTHDDQITVCDLTGTGVQDTAIAVHAYNILKNYKAGSSIGKRNQLTQLT
ncbi:cyclodeaminase [Pseudalkalibacillus caeni]|uniref:Cyclodeaminase n=1 Tax=Exobacillus caeni TaxID=2574798 RepID=A0A5R9EZ85_9BACL|nr:cyclodeaminase [Pseudalkalibacillus caeni]TLS36151.1 cyclodeaminase [Pseudalkalibacillus caeni]